MTIAIIVLSITNLILLVIALCLTLYCSDLRGEDHRKQLDMSIVTKEAARKVAEAEATLKAEKDRAIYHRKRCREVRRKLWELKNEQKSL